MARTIEVESIERLDVQPGETLVVTLPSDCLFEDVVRVKDEFQDRLPEGVKLLVLNGAVRLGVVARSDEA